MLISGEDVCCSVVFGTLVGVFAFNVQPIVAHCRLLYQYGSIDILLLYNSRLFFQMGLLYATYVNVFFLQYVL